MTKGPRNSKQPSSREMGLDIQHNFFQDQQNNSLILQKWFIPLKSTEWTHGGPPNYDLVVPQTKQSLGLGIINRGPNRKNRDRDLKDRDRNVRSAVRSWPPGNLTFYGQFGVWARLTELTELCIRPITQPKTAHLNRSVNPRYTLDI